MEELKELVKKYYEFVTNVLVTESELFDNYFEKMSNYDKDYYKSIDAVKQKFTDTNGVFDENAFDTCIDDADCILHSGAEAFFYRKQRKRNIPFFPDLCKPVGQCFECMCNSRYKKERRLDYIPSSN